MRIELKHITIRELVNGYSNDLQTLSVVGYGGLLNIRPPYQREFIYKDIPRNRVIDTVHKGFPLNVLYWSVNDNGTFEVLDGQQRIISICEYIVGNFSIDSVSFHNLPKDLQERFLDYELMVYFCEGEASEKLAWFEIINIAGERLNQQELRNAIYSGSWVSDARRYFSKPNCPAYDIANMYLNGSSIRQEYLETAIDWISNGSIADYMNANKSNPTAIELWNYFQSVINWVKSTFPNYRKEMKGVEWGHLYNQHGTKLLDPKALESEVSKLMEDEDIQNKKGIYRYVLSGEEKYLNIRAFPDSIKRSVYEKQKGRCASKNCASKEKYELKEMHADHIDPWSKGGRTIKENCQLLCASCNRRKSNI